jgi:hypothetical protein
LKLLEEVDILVDFLELLFLSGQHMAALACDGAVPLKLVVEALSVTGRAARLLSDD